MKVCLADEFFAVGVSITSFFKVLSRMASVEVRAIRCLLFTCCRVQFLLTSARGWSNGLKRCGGGRRCGDGAMGDAVRLERAMGWTPEALSL